MSFVNKIKTIYNNLTNEYLLATNNDINLKINRLVDIEKKGYLSSNSVLNLAAPGYSNFDLSGGIVYACIDKRAKAFAKYEQKMTINDKPFEDHWILNLLKSNRLTSWYSIKNLLSQWLDLNGNAYIWTPLEGKRLPEKIFVLPSDRVMPQIDYANNIIKGYLISVGAKSQIVPIKEICHIKILSPTSAYETSLYLGTPNLLNAARELITAEVERLGYFKRNLKRDNTAPFVIVTPEDMGVDEWVKFKEAYNTAVPPEFRARAILDNGKKIELLAGGQSNTQSLMLDSQTITKEITSIFGVPIGLLTSDFSNRATAEVIKAEFYENTIEPLVTMFNEELTNHFRQFEPQIEFYSEFAKYSDPEYNLKANDFYLKNGIINRNDIRAELELEPLPDGDEYWIPLEFRKTEIVPPVNTSNVENVTEQTIEENSNDMTNKIYEEYKILYWKSYDNLMSKHEKKIQYSVKKTFEALKNDIVKNNKSVDLVNGISLFDIEKWKEIITKNCSKDVADLIISTLQKVILELGEGSLTDFEQSIIDMTKMSTNKISESINTIHDDLKLKLQTIIESNPLASQSELLNLFMTETSDMFSRVYTESRAKTIARTTTTFSTNNAQEKVFTKYEREFVWLSQRDGKVRDTHKKADGDKPESDGYFKVGHDKMKHPAAGSLAEENVNCRCVLFPVKKTKSFKLYLESKNEKAA